MIAAAEGLTQASGTDISQLQPWAQNLATISKGRTIGIHMGALGIAYNFEIMAEKGVAPPPSGKTWQSPSMLVKLRSPTQILRALPYTELATITQLFGQDEAMKVLADIGKNVNSYTKPGSAPSKAAARGKTGISAMGKGRGDAFVVGLIGLIIALVSVFVFYPVFHILVQAFLAPLFAITDAEAPPLR